MQVGDTADITNHSGLTFDKVELLLHYWVSKHTHIGGHYLVPDDYPS